MSKTNWRFSGDKDSLLKSNLHVVRKNEKGYWMCMCDSVFLHFDVFRLAKGLSFCGEVIYKSQNLPKGPGFRVHRSAGHLWMSPVTK